MTTTAKNNLLYNRYWRISVVPEIGLATVISDSSYGEKALHCQFEVNYAYEARTYGRIRIYNLSKETITQLYNTAVNVVIEAGYQNCDYGTPAVIWNAKAYHFIEYRENVVDRILDIYTVNAPDSILYNTFVYGTISGSIKDVFDYVTKENKRQMISSPTLETANIKLVRPFQFFGGTQETLNTLANSISPNTRAVADANGNLSLVDMSVNATSNTPEITISPESGLIGLPNQVPYGVNFKTLLDPRLRWTVPTPVLVKFKNSEIKGLFTQIGNPPALPLDENGIYKIVSLTHTGDTRGNDWYTQVETVSDLSKITQRAL